VEFVLFVVHECSCFINSLKLMFIRNSVREGLYFYPFRF